MSNIIRITGTGGAARQNAAAISGSMEHTVNIEEVRRVLGGVGKKLAATVTAPSTNTNKDKAGTNRKPVAEKKRTRREVKSQRKASKYWLDELNHLAV